MLKYVDQQLVADSSQTRRILAWRPTPRKSITRRLVFLVENMKRNPELWRNWNEAMLHRETHRPHLVLQEWLCDLLEADREAALQAVTAELLAGDGAGQA